MISSNTSLDRLVGAMEHAQSHWESRRRAAAQPRTTAAHPAWTVALDRETGTPGSTLAHALGQRLGWQVYDHELLEKIAQEMGLRTRLLESVDERHANWVHEAVREVMEAISSAPSVSESAYVGHLVETLLALSRHGECIIVGRGAAQVLPASTTLRVKLTAPLETRTAAVAAQLGVSARDAAKRIHDSDRQRERFLHEHFAKDAEDLRHYDLVLNSSRCTGEHCVDIIVDALHHLQEQCHPADRAVWEEHEADLVTS